MKGDLVQRLRDRAYSFKVPDPLSEEAAGEIDRLRGYRDAAEADAGVARLLVEKLRLTDEERAAVEFAAEHLRHSGWGSATLRGLLERLKTVGCVPKMVHGWEVAPALLRNLCPSCAGTRFRNTPRTYVKADEKATVANMNGEWIPATERLS